MDLLDDVISKLEHCILLNMVDVELLCWVPQLDPPVLVKLSFRSQSRENL